MTNRAVSESSRTAPVSNRGEPWIETKEGGLFFLNALLVAPEFMVLFPLTLRGIFRGLGILNRPSMILDPIPAIAAHFLPVVGIALIIPLVLTVRNLRIARLRAVRVALSVFLLSHLGFLAYTVWSWITPG